MIKNKKELLGLMQRKAMVITPNNRLSNELINEFLRENQALIQDKPLCLPYSAFLQNCYKQLCHSQAHSNHPLVLTNQQRRYLLRRLVSKTTANPPNEGLLEALEDAWTRCHLWQIDFAHPSFAQTPQTSQFRRWAIDLLEELDKIAAITEDQLANYLISQQNPYPYQGLVWACFDDYTPQQLALQHYFNAQGCQIQHYELAEQTSQIYRYAAKDSHDENQQLIAWLKSCLAKQEKRITVVVPDLQSQAQQLKRLLQQQLPTEFNISLGQALADYPLVAHAFCWLGLDSKQLSANEAQLLLHSPFLAHSQTEMLARAQFREESTILQEHQFSHSSFLKAIEKPAPKLAELLGTLVPYPAKDSPQGWLNHFSNRLFALGFPGEYALNSSSYQCYQRFLALFDEFKQLALLSHEMTEAEALATFKNLAKSTIFQAKNTETTIQILGLLEAAGCSFDSLWVTGLTDQCLPQKTKLSAFIPLSLQRENHMPHASPARELKLAEKALARLVNSSPLVVLSYPHLSNDQPNMPSPLIGSFPAFIPQEIKPIWQESKLVNYEEDYQLPLAADEKATGGTAILANQAKCPFRAFAAHRLHAKTTLELSDGPDARERGQLIHKVMELLWQKLQNQHNLLTLDPKELDNIIEQAIHQALEPIIQQRAYSFSTLVQEVEKLKLRRLVQACLDWERQRPHFEVEALEQAFTINLAGIDFRLRVDRLDRLEQGNKWVIDYKSSLPTSLPWKEERPKEPQLLLYALLDETINGLLFAQLKAGQLSCKGLTEENHGELGLSTIKKEEHWAEYRQHWQTQLDELAEEFCQGYCPPQPATQAICQLCDFQNLCRFK
ncbi:putative DNA repair protein [Legionella massiliensis]|uniref:Putative DNA repair protein n=1 Tax=Legionella massiliensis TaxID=1034943 RepID=A0A078KRG3_9GAMM|nr:PD-(D/E)XK nuclease family protein [Legionella massiliensis]CDZ77005.1 putative DNA repair protein [Legionella massiliensis]CEE12743.1 ATP-dependent helicase/deoxyribonuclease subunit B [Legionella massiliensis]